MTEDELLTTIIGTPKNPGLARILKWRVAHFRAAQTAKGWRTPVQGDGKGFFDLVLARPKPVPRLIFAELKSDTGKLSPEQELWFEAAEPDGPANWEIYLWRPRDLQRIAEILR